MVNDTIDIASHILDFNFDSSVKQQQQQQQQQKQQETLQRSASNNTLRKNQQRVHQKLAKQDQQDKRNSVNLQILPSSAENLSWTFFDKVSTLDNQLRGDEE
ncbi:PREDICTED: probable basic-leucine zipper transcription factor K, partial [Rhagoletis zephyria]|uniref:probable basic-leucine zipper transcription factor K n=1 Tax=Rhagoletis zephyria TaxID=28612 RepID=UPI00081179FD